MTRRHVYDLRLHLKDVASPFHLREADPHLDRGPGHATPVDAAPVVTAVAHRGGVEELSHRPRHGPAIRRDRRGWCAWTRPRAASK
jgi:hypothetical protein